MMVMMLVFQICKIPAPYLLPLTQYDAFPKGYLISNFPSIVRVLNLVINKGGCNIWVMQFFVEIFKDGVHIGSFLYGECY